MAFSVPNPPKGQDSDVATAQLSEPSSVPNSQGSSASPQRPMSSDKFQFSAGNYSARQITPSTSSSDPSSQERAAERLQEILSAEDDAQQQFRPHLQNAQIERPQSLHIGSLNGEHTYALKRMADGKVKTVDLNMSRSPVDVSRSRGHSRNDRKTSKGSQIGELSNHLKTRLSYAMVKVQNGWQTRSIDELESMTSQQASPISPVSDLRRPYESPRTNLMNTQFDRAGFTQSSERTTATLETLHPSPQVYSRTSRLDYAYSQTDDIVSPQSGQSSRTYESFWREHSASNASRYLHTQNSAEAPSLAPPADILPRNVRRSNGLQAQPPALQTSNQHSFSSSGSAPSAMPATPPQRHVVKPRTPSQNAAMEQDAVETLLFMSSPGNSGYHPPNQLPATSLRTQLSAMYRKPHSAAAISSNHTSNEQLQPIRPLSDHLDSRRFVNGADIDKLLDEMPDEISSSDEDDLKTIGVAQPYV